jgi:hypothetical protein
MESRKFKNIEIKFSEGNHQYYVDDDGKKIRPASVSKIIKGDDGFGIGAMAGRKNYLETLVEELPNSGLLKVNDLTDLQEKLFDIKKMAEQKWKDQAMIGTIIHNFIESYLRGSMSQNGYHKGHTEQDNQIRLMQYPLYEYLNKSVRKVHAVEYLVYDNSVLPYAGKFDCWIDHAQYGECLVDWKTVTKKSSGKLWSIQLVGYMYALCNELGREPFNRLIVAIDKETKEIKEYLYDVDSYVRDLQIWKNYLQIYSFLNEKKK